MFISILQTINELLAAGISITAFSLLLYALTLNLKDRVVRSFAFILACVVVVFTGDALSSITARGPELEFWLRLQWVGIVFLPPAYLHFSDALLATTGRPSRGRRRLAVRLVYVISFAFLAALPLSLLVGPMVESHQPAPYLARTPLTWIFTAYYALIILWAGVNLLRAYQRTVSSASRRRMAYLMIGGMAPALGSYPYLLLGPDLAANHPAWFWLAAMISNLMVSALLVLMSYGVAFFGVPWPDRVVKRRLFKWLMRGPVTASTVLAITTLARRAGERFGLEYNAAVPVLMVASILVLQYAITLAAPYWERWLFHGGDRQDIDLLQRMEERLLTSSDLRQFLESVLAAICDQLQSPAAFVTGVGEDGLETLISIGSPDIPEQSELSDGLLEQVHRNGFGGRLFSWGEYWLVPLFAVRAEGSNLLGLLGVSRQPGQSLEPDQLESLLLLSQRTAMALEDRLLQRQVFASLEVLTPEVELIQTLRAATRYGGRGALVDVLTQPEVNIEQGNLSRWVKDALTHYWGGPKLTDSPLMRLKIVQRALQEHEGNPTNALRSILRSAVEQVRPEGERRFTGEWILYNILEMKFMEGRKVREVAMRLAMSEADLYRKQRVAIEAVANAMLEMEKQALEEETLPSSAEQPNPSSEAR